MLENMLSFVPIITDCVNLVPSLNFAGGMDTAPCRPLRQSAPLRLRTVCLQRSRHRHRSCARAMCDATSVRGRLSRADPRRRLRMRTQRDDGKVRESVLACAPRSTQQRQQSGTSACTCVHRPTICCICVYDSFVDFVFGLFKQYRPALHVSRVTAHCVQLT